jgi:hypothetical protein
MMTARRWMMAGALALAFAATGAAEDAATFPPGGIAEALRARVGKAVTLHLTSGTQIGGTVVEVRDHAVVVKAIAGRELSDALIALDQVAAVEVRARER